MPPVRGVLFDLDNTLVDRDRAFLAYATWLARQRLGLRDDGEVRAAVAFLAALDAGGYGPKPAMFAALLARYPTLGGDVADLLAEFRRELRARLPGLDDGAAALLADLERRGLPWGIVTNGSAGQLAKIQALDLERRATVILISEVAGCRKPDREIFLRAVAGLGTAPAATLFVGDNPVADIRGAHQAGLRTAWLRRGRAWPAGITDCAPDSIVDSLSGLRPLLGSPDAVTTG